MGSVQPGGSVKSCAHDNVETVTQFMRLTDVEGGPVTGFQANFRVTCLDCGTPFVFLGEVGLHPRSPRASLDGLELRVPMALQPSGEALIDKIAGRQTAEG